AADLPILDEHVVEIAADDGVDSSCHRCETANAVVLLFRPARGGDVADQRSARTGSRLSRQRWQEAVAPRQSQAESTLDVEITARRKIGVDACRGAKRR